MGGSVAALRSTRPMAALSAYVKWVNGESHSGTATMARGRSESTFATLVSLTGGRFFERSNPPFA